MKSRRIMVLTTLLALFVVVALVMTACGGGEVTKTITSTVTTTVAGTGATVTVTQPGPATTVTQTATKTVTQTVSGGATTTPTGPVTTIKFAVAWPDTFSSCQAMKWAGAKIEALTGGQIKFEYYWAGSVVAAFEEINALKSGVIDLTFGHVLYYPDIFRLSYWPWCVAFTPEDPQTYITLQMRLLREFPEMQKEISSIPSVKAFYENTFGPYLWMGRYPINDILTDVQGKKIQASGTWNPKWWQAVGAQTVPGTAAEVFTNIQTRVVDGVATSPLTIDVGLKLWDAGAKYITYFEQGSRNGGWELMNLAKWNSLSPDIQRIFDQVMWEAAYKSADLVDELNANAESIAKANGVQTNILSKEQQTKWGQLIAPYVQQWIKSLEDKGLPGTQFVKRLQDISADLGSPMPFKYVQ